MSNSNEESATLNSTEKIFYDPGNKLTLIGTVKKAMEIHEEPF
jgi:hypothetical protein